MRHSNSSSGVGTVLTTIFLAFSVLAPQAWAQVSLANSNQGVVLDFSQKEAVQSLLNQEAVSLKDFGVETPGLLSSNPFYFIKNLRRSTQRVFVFSSTKKAEVELGILDEKAAELKFGFENLLRDPDELESVLEEYELTLDRLGYYAKNLAGGAKNSSLDRFFGRLTDRFIKHLKLLDEIAARAEAGQKETINQLRKNWASVLSAAIEFDSILFSDRVSKTVTGAGGSPFKELRAAEILDWADSSLASASQDQINLILAEENLLLAFEARMASGNLQSLMPVVLESLAGDLGHRVQVLDELREYSPNAEFRSNLSVLRQLLLEFASRSRLVSKSDAEESFNSANNLLAAVKAKLVGNAKTGANLAAFSRAEFNLKQVPDSLKNSQYSNAFGQSSVAEAALKNILSGFSHRGILDKELPKLKEQYDGLSKDLEVLDSDDEEYQNLISSVRELEKKIGELSDLVSKGKLDNAVLLLREVKVALNKALFQFQDFKDRASAGELKETLIEKVFK